MNTTWILVANNAQARIHALGNRWDDLDCIAQYSNPFGEAHENELCTEQDSAVMQWAGHGQRAKTESKASNTNGTQDEFAGMLANQLLEGRVKHCFDDLVLVAPLAMLGKLHEAIDDTTRAYVSNEFDKNVCQLSAEELSKYLCDALNP